MIEKIILINLNVKKKINVHLKNIYILHTKENYLTYNLCLKHNYKQLLTIREWQTQ